MRAPTGRGARLATLTTLCIATGAPTAVAVTSPPASGEWIGSNRTEFTVSSDHRRVQQFEHRCGPKIMPVEVIRIRADGRFTLDRRISQPDGTRYRYRITGRFTTAYEATGRVRSPRCQATFKANARAAPEPESAPEPAPPAEVVEPE